MLEPNEIQRYSRQLLLSEIGSSGQEKLKNARVLVIGVGGLGCPVLMYLAAAGIGELGLVDADQVSISNLPRQILFTDQDIGKPKVRVASERIQQLNGSVQCTLFQHTLNETNASELVEQFDIVVDCTDSIQARYLISEACVSAGKPMVYAGIHKFEGQLAVFNVLQSDGTRTGNFTDAFKPSKMDAFSSGCEINGVLGTLPGMLGIMQANEVIKWITGIGQLCTNRVSMINGLTLQWTDFHYSSHIKA
jgi:adenylyltransferase/sulfurtransferase